MYTNTNGKYKVSVTLLPLCFCLHSVGGIRTGVETIPLQEAA